MRKASVRAAGIVAVASVFLSSAAYADANPSIATAAAASSVLAAAAPLLPQLDHLDFKTQAPRAADAFDQLKGMIRHRFASAMVDLYPAAATGFHLSVGTRFFKRQYIRRDQETETNGLLYSPRMPRGGFGQRGFRRATAAATLGYTETIGSNLMLGLEGGTLFGRAVDRMPHGARLAGLPGGRDDEARMQMNPVLNLTVAYAF